MPDVCRLREANEVHGESCDGSTCVYWRAIEYLGVVQGEGCALQHYELLGDVRMAQWLLSVKERVEGEGSAPRD